MTAATRNGQALPDTWRKKPVDVEVMQFRDWGTALRIMAWAPGVIYVPEGFEHGLRTEGEHDRSRGDVLNTAAAFLAVPDEMDLGGSVRVSGYRRANFADYIVRTSDGAVITVPQKQFESAYERVHDL